MNLLRKCINEMTPYVPGLQLNDSDIIKLNTNENPYPPPEKVLQVLHQHINGNLRLYPDPSSNELRNMIARTYSITQKNILVGNGSDEILSLIFRAFIDPYDTVFLFYPTYTLYHVLAQSNNAQIIEVQLDDTFNIPNEAFNVRCKLCCVPNPNVPSGNFIPQQTLIRLANAIEGILVIDEAYVDFAEDNCLSLLSRADNIIITRTFSKSFSLAGLRIGYALASIDIIDGLMRIKDSYNLNSLSAIAAKTALDAIDSIRTQVQQIKATRETTAKQLVQLGFDVLPSQTNFLFVRLAKIPARFLYEKLLERKILVRYFDQPRIKDYIRITIGTEQDMSLLTQHIREIMEIL